MFPITTVTSKTCYILWHKFVGLLITMIHTILENFSTAVDIDLWTLGIGPYGPLWTFICNCLYLHITMKINVIVMPRYG